MPAAVSSLALERQPHDVVALLLLGQLLFRSPSPARPRRAPATTRQSQLFHVVPPVVDRMHRAGQRQGPDRLRRSAVRGRGSRVRGSRSRLVRGNEPLGPATDLLITPNRTREPANRGLRTTGRAAVGRALGQARPQHFHRKERQRGRGDDIQHPPRPSLGQRARQRAPGRGPHEVPGQRQADVHCGQQQHAPHDRRVARNELRHHDQIEARDRRVQQVRQESFLDVPQRRPPHVVSRQQNRRARWRERGEHCPTSRVHRLSREFCPATARTDIRRPVSRQSA